MQAGFRSPLVTEYLTGEYYRLALPLAYYTRVISREIVVPAGFVTDLESVPRLPIVYMCLGHTSLRGGAVHDYLYRKDSYPRVSRAQADAIYREISVISAVQYILESGKEPTAIQIARIHSQAWSKWLGVRIGGAGSYHKKTVAWRPI